MSNPLNSRGSSEGTVSRFRKIADYILPLFTLIAVAFYIGSLSSYTLVIEASAGGVPLGYVESRDDFGKAERELESRLSDATGEAYELGTHIQYSFTHVKNPTYLTSDECSSILENLAGEDFCDAYMLYVDDVRAAAYENYDGLYSLISNIESDLLASGGDEFSRVEISNRLRIEAQPCLKSSLKSLDEINALLNPLANKVSAADEAESAQLSVASLDSTSLPVSDENEVSEPDTDEANSQSGDSGDNTPAVKYSAKSVTPDAEKQTSGDGSSGTQVTMRVSAFSAAGPSEDGGVIDPNVDYGVVRQGASGSEASGSELTLSYRLIRTETADETIFFETKYVDDPDHYLGTETVTSEGADGVRRVTYEISCDSEGRELEKTAVSESIITPAQDRIIMVGTSEIPDAVPTGTYIWPCVVSQGISSGYGSRDLYGSYDFHLGIDIPGDDGTEIYASDGGEVIWSGFTPSYGYSVRIQHSSYRGSYYITLYAHLEKALVSVGDKVYQGQQIGLMGHTGAAYGTHLHFEVRIGSVTVNPTKYLPKLNG